MNPCVLALTSFLYSLLMQGAASPTHAAARPGGPHKPPAYSRCRAPARLVSLSDSGIGLQLGWDGAPGLSLCRRWAREDTCGLGRPADFLLISNEGCEEKARRNMVGQETTMWKHSRKRENGSERKTPLSEPENERRRRDVGARYSLSGARLVIFTFVFLLIKENTLSAEKLGT